MRQQDVARLAILTVWRDTPSALAAAKRVVSPRAYRRRPVRRRGRGIAAAGQNARARAPLALPQRPSLELVFLFLFVFIGRSQVSHILSRDLQNLFSRENGASDAGRNRDTIAWP